MCKCMTSAAVAAVVLVWAGGVQAEVVIETVPVGNPGNAADIHGAGYGAVSYAYNIGKYEVTAGQYTEFLNAVAGTDTYGLYNAFMWSFAFGCRIERTGSPGSYWYGVSPSWARRPVNYISYGDAARFANWLHNGQPTGAQGLGTTEDGSYFVHGATTHEQVLSVLREPDATWVIPSEDEWYKAAYHCNDGPAGNYFDYPTSTDSIPSNDLIHPDPGNNANFYDDGATIGGPYYRTVVGAFENSSSPYGTFDQGGNVSERTDAVSSGWYPRVLGGSFGRDSSVYFLHAGAGSSWFQTTEHYSTGFRVAEVPVPAMCGNGVVDRLEECDDAGESATCDADCTFAVCGDGTLNPTAGEECDWQGRDCCGTSCHFEPVGASCDDGDPCNGVETCIEDGVCISQVIEDCNENGMPDECDITDGTSADYNGNGIPDECELAVYVDIRPGSCPNPVKPRSGGVVPAAIVGGESFDVTQIDVDTLTLRRADGVGGIATPLSGPPGPGIRTDDVAAAFTGDLCDCHGLGGDGIDDLLLRFSTPELAGAFQLSELPSGASVMLTLGGSLLDGTTFLGSDCVVLPGKPARAGQRGSRKRR